MLINMSRGGNYVRLNSLLRFYQVASHPRFEMSLEHTPGMHHHKHVNLSLSHIHMYTSRCNYCAMVSQACWQRTWHPLLCMLAHLYFPHASRKIWICTALTLLPFWKQNIDRWNFQQKSWKKFNTKNISFQ